MKKTNMDFIGWNKNILAASLRKISLNIFLIVFLDALFYILSGYALVLWVQRIQAKMASFYLPSNLIEMAPDAARQLASQVKGFYFLIVSSLLLLVIAIIFIASILKGVIWAKTTKTKITFRLISSFFLANLVWMGFWIVVIFLIAYLAVPAYAPVMMVASVILGLYFTNTFYALFMKEQRINAILQAVSLNVSKFHLFLLPYAAIYLILYVMIKLGDVLEIRYSSILLGVLLLFYAAIVRYYASELSIEVARLKELK